MASKQLTFIAFLMLALVQLYIPAKMIADRENTLQKGVAYKFKVAPVDPNDPFRGKYITLSFEENEIEVPAGQEWKRNDDIYVHLTTDEEGFAEVLSVSKEKPAAGTDYVVARVNHAYQQDGQQKINFNYPFDRFYMEESKAYEAELAYRESLQDTSRQAYAVVNVKGSSAVLSEVLIDGIPIREIAKNRRDKQQN